MSTGPFVWGVAAALVVGASVVSASGEKPKPGSHEVAASAYSATFPTGAMCASGTTRASRETLSNPFAAFGGSSAYAQMFFRAGFNAGVAASAASTGGRSASLVSMPASGRPGNGNGRAPNAAFVTVPGTLARGGATTLSRGTPAVGANPQALLARSDVSATPEPATLLLLTTGIGGVFLARRRSRSSN
jgi:hypothetical protein